MKQLIKKYALKAAMVAGHGKSTETVSGTVVVAAGERLWNAASESKYKGTAVCG